MVEKDIEQNVKNLILAQNIKELDITNEFLTDGIIRYGGRPIALLEFKLKRNLTNENTVAQILTQTMCYYYKIANKEHIDTNKPFYLIIGDDNEVLVINIHQYPLTWMLNPTWGTTAPSKACKEPGLLLCASSMLKLIPPIYYKYENLNELSFGFHLLFSNLMN